MTDATIVQLPAEPCVVIWDGEKAVVATERTCEPVRQWASWGGPVARSVMVTRLRAFADLIEGAAGE